MPNTAFLDHLTKPSDLVETDEGAAEEDESLVDVGAPLVSRMVRRRKQLSQTSRAFDGPAVPAEPFAAVEASPGNAGRDHHRLRHSLRQR